MALVQIEQSELDTLRAERDAAKNEAAQHKQHAEEADRKVEQAEAKVAQVEEAKAAAEREAESLKENARKAELKAERMGKLGDKFVAKLGETTKSNLQSQAQSMSDDEWDKRLTEVEELVAVKRDAKTEGGGSGADEHREEHSGAPTFGTEELARLGGLSGGSSSSGAPTEPSTIQRQSVARGLAKALAK